MATAPILIAFAASFTEYRKSLAPSQTSACWYLEMKREISLASIRHPRRPPPGRGVYRSISISIDPTMLIFSERTYLYLSFVFAVDSGFGSVDSGLRRWERNQHSFPPPALFLTHPKCIYPDIGRFDEMFNSFLNSIQREAKLRSTGISRETGDESSPYLPYRRIFSTENKSPALGCPYPKNSRPSAASSDHSLGD